MRDVNYTLLYFCRREGPGLKYATGKYQQWWKWFVCFFNSSRDDDFQAAGLNLFYILLTELFLINDFLLDEANSPHTKDIMALVQVYTKLPTYGQEKEVHYCFNLKIKWSLNFFSFSFFRSYLGQTSHCNSSLSTTIVVPEISSWIHHSIVQSWRIKEK